MNGAHDFDFWIGCWDVRHKRLKVRLRGSTDWERFDGQARARFLPGGIGNIDELTAETWRPGYVGMTVRLFDRARCRWSIHWADNIHGVFDPPLYGRFTDGLGVFEGDDHHEGIPVRVRFLWKSDGRRAARWEQAFSADGGATWETNWIMNFTRAEE